LGLEDKQGDHISVAYNWGVNSNDEKEILRVSVINDGG